MTRVPRDKEHMNAESLIVRRPDGEIVELVACNKKSRSKSLEQGELWIVDPQTERVLPFQGGGVPYDRFLERAGWYEVTLRAVGADGRHPLPSSETREAGADAGESAGGPSGESAASDASRELARNSGAVLKDLGDLIAERRQTMPEGSYTTHLFSKGGEKIRKKTGEEAVELILARNRDDLRSEAADLLYHLMVLLEAHEMRIEDVVDELAARHRRG
jgi:phosphoribosyl-ATP pyrophosphohydrolase